MKDNKEYVKQEQSYKAKPDQARLILNKIYNAMFVSQFQKCAPESLVYDDLCNLKAKESLNFKTFINKLSNEYGNGPWQYFSKRKLFEPETDLGYDEDTFDEEWKAAKNQMAELILYIGQHVKAGVEAGE